MAEGIGKTFNTFHTTSVSVLGRQQATNRISLGVIIIHQHNNVKLNASMYNIVIGRNNIFELILLNYC
jgi:hypothetical protein